MLTMFNLNMMHILDDPAIYLEDQLICYMINLIHPCQSTTIVLTARSDSDNILSLPSKIARFRYFF